MRLKSSSVHTHVHVRTGTCTKLGHKAGERRTLGPMVSLVCLGLRGH